MSVIIAENSVVKSLIIAPFGVSFPQRGQHGTLEWVKISSCVSGWQAEGGLDYQNCSWGGERGSIKLVLRSG